MSLNINEQLSLRPYQQTCIERADINVLVIAHRQELLQQAADKYRLIDPIAIIGLVIIDECHHSAAAGSQTVLDVLPQAFVLGVTATPDRLDKQNIETVFGEPVYTASIIDMVEQGYLCDLRAVAIRTTTSLDGLHTQAGDFKQDELEEVIDTPERNRRIVEAYLEHGKGRQALCFAIMDWRRLRNSGYVLEVGTQKHLVYLVPSEETDGYYSVWARLAPDFTRQQWLRDAPLDWAQQHAERQARLLMADSKNTVLVDRNASWRYKPVDLFSKQATWLRRFGIPITEEMTRGEASDLLEQAFAEGEHRKAEKQAKQAHKAVKRARASA